MSVVTFTGYTPVARFDSTHWTLARIDEAEDSTGPWTTIDTISLSPYDTDPTQPAPRDFTTDNATLAEGWYRIVFLDGAGNEQLTDPTSNAPATNFMPKLDQIGKLIRSRTWDGRGVQLGTFTDSTQPDADTVVTLAIEAANQIADTLGHEVPEAFVARARSTAALAAAQLVEIGAEDPRQAVIDSLGRMFDARLTALAKEMQEVGAGDKEGPSDNALMPAYSFPTVQADTPFPGWPFIGRNDYIG